MLKNDEKERTVSMEECVNCGKPFDPIIEQSLYDNLVEDIVDWDRSYKKAYCAECCFAGQEETYFYDPYD